jgi:putative sterol carrier protein/limonene-1,2-epoxide hydrolase
MLSIEVMKMQRETNEESTTTVEPEDVVREYIDAKDRHDWDALVKLLDPDFVSSDPSLSEPVRGVQAISQYFPMLEQVGMKTKILTILSKGEDVAAELAVTCTIQEDDKPRSFTVTFAKFYRVNSKGLLVDEREYSDTAAKFKAMGQTAAGEFESFGEDGTAKPEVAEKDAANKKDEFVTTDPTPKAIFESRILENLKSNLDKLADVNAICQFDIAGDTGGSWYIDMTVTPPAVVAGTSDKAKCTISCTDKELVGIMNGKINATLAVVTGKLKISGDMGLASVLRTILN